ncbi:MAG: DUF2299 domain-containing protein [Methanobacteriaceae archaeon]|jgi:hypothetical protein|nr:DUF2299 domain-containing protein [Candidatus Methanorudis spinitermitis]
MIDEKQVRDWLAEEGVFKEKIPDDSANFHFIINYPEGHIMDIIQPENKIDMILIGCATEVAPEQVSAIRSSSESKKQEFIWDLRLSLNQFLLDFELEHPNDELHRFVITEELYEDALNKHNLILGMKKVFKGKLQCIWLLGKSFGEIDPNSIEDTNSMFG